MPEAETAISSRTNASAAQKPTVYDIRASREGPDARLGPRNGFHTRNQVRSFAFLARVARGSKRITPEPDVRPHVQMRPNRGSIPKF